MSQSPSSQCNCRHTVGCTPWEATSSDFNTYSEVLVTKWSSQLINTMTSLRRMRGRFWYSEFCPQCSISSKRIVRRVKKQPWMTHTLGKKSATEAACKRDQLLDLIDKGFKVAIRNRCDEVKETMMKGVKDNQFRPPYYISVDQRIHFMAHTVQQQAKRYPNI